MLIGREKEFGLIESLISTSLKDKSSLCVYISGPPGTGKTATVKEVINHLQWKIDKNGRHKEFHFVSIDCFASSTTTSLAQHILLRLETQTKISNGKQVLQALENKISKCKIPILILLDEVDNLVSRKDEIIYDAFNWPNKFPGRVIVIGIFFEDFLIQVLCRRAGGYLKRNLVCIISFEQESNRIDFHNRCFTYFYTNLGISNSLDLTERQLSKIKFAHPPKSIVFPPYTSEMLISILSSYLNDIGNKSSIIDTKAIELCARKVASMTGDVRRALDIASQMIVNFDEELEEEQNSPKNDDKLKEVNNKIIDMDKNEFKVQRRNSLKTPLKEESKENVLSLKRRLPQSLQKGDVTPKKNACREVLNAINKTMASPCQRSKLPQHPRILLATLMRLISSDTEKVLLAPDSSPFHTPPRTPKRSEFATPTRLNRTPKRLFSTNNGKSVQNSQFDSSSVTRDRLFQAYLLVCEKLMLQPLATDELDNAYEVLESQAIISLSKPINGKNKQQRVCFMVEMSLARQAINDNELIASIEDIEL
uniref:AAA+ ATPase domain-containing protein n=1 Tax=Meloidogyne incognita TaxID=6306 RepID=A0A914L6J5_MELIC